MGSDDGVKHITRREMLKIVGVSGLGLAAAASGAGRAIQLSAAGLGPEDDAPEGFLAWAFDQRARAMTNKDLKLLESTIDPASTQLLAFEKDRAAFMHDLGARWKGRVLHYSTVVTLVHLERSGSVAKARVYETTDLFWIPTPRPVSPAAAALMKKHPEKTLTAPQGSRGEISSGFGVQHELLLERGTTGWRLIEDSYEEPDLLGGSPNLKPGSWSAVRAGKPFNGALALQASPSADGYRPTTTYYWYPSMAVDYARAYYSSYNSAYCDYNACGGDCGNFVSQCLRAGNQVNGGNWYTFNGACGTCGTTSSNAGTDTWAHNGYLRSWVISASRGWDETSIDEILAGDLVNYDWDGGGFDHIAILSDGVNKLVCSHNPNRRDAEWTLGGAQAYDYTWIKSPYDA